jgi:hypothetical protein
MGTVSFAPNLLPNTTFVMMEPGGNCYFSPIRALIITFAGRRRIRFVETYDLPVRQISSR